MKFSYDLLWTARLWTRRVVVHRIGNLQTSATTPDGTRISTVRTACGSGLIARWGGKQTMDHGVYILEGHADALGAKRCGNCFKGGAR